jgi:hypothetical protein
MFSCKNPNREEFIGKWESEDKAMIVLNEDNTCVLRNLDATKIWGAKNDSEIKEINSTGKWEFVSPDKLSRRYRIYIHYDKGHFPLFMMGTGLTGYFRPWKLFDYIGDPDDMNLYEF